MWRLAGTAETVKKGAEVREQLVWPVKCLRHRGLKISEISGLTTTVVTGNIKAGI